MYKKYIKQNKTKNDLSTNRKKNLKNTKQNDSIKENLNIFKLTLQKNL